MLIHDNFLWSPKSYLVFFSKCKNFFTYLLILFIFSNYFLVTIQANNQTSLHRESSSELAKKAKKLVRNDNFEEAETIYRQLATINSDDCHTQIELILFLIKVHKLDDALIKAANAVNKFPYEAKSHSTFGLALLRSGLVSQAYDESNIALKLNKKDHVALATLAEIAYYESHLQEAEQLINGALSVNQKEPDYYLLQARIASRREQFRVAAQALRNFLRIASKTDLDKRARIEGVIRFYSYLGDSSINVVQNLKTTALPLTIRGRRPYIQLMINNKGPLNFVVDTGTSISVISTKAAERLGIKPIATGGQATAVGGTGTFPIVYGLLNNIQIGDVKISSVPIYIREINGTQNQAPNNGVDGFLGLSALTEFLVVLDYTNSQLVLEPTTKEENSLTTKQEKIFELPFRLTESGLISVQVRIDDSSDMNFILDSGASTSVVSDAAIDRLQWHNKILLDQKIRIIGAAGITQDVSVILAKSLQVTELEKKNMRLPILDLALLNETSGFEQSGILGGDFLQHCTIAINLRNNTLFLIPIQNELLDSVQKAKQ